MVNDGPSGGADAADADNAALSAYIRIQSVTDAERRSFEPSRLIERRSSKSSVGGPT